MRRRSTESSDCKARAAKVAVQRKSRVQPGLAHGARSQEPAHHLRGDRAGGDRAKGKPRRAFPRRLSGRRTRSTRTFNIVLRQEPTARCSSTRRPIPAMPAELQADHRGDEADHERASHSATHIRQTGKASSTRIRPRRASANASRNAANARSASGAATTTTASSWTTRQKSSRAWSCSMRCTRSRRAAPTTWPCAGTARPASAARARRRSTASRS